MEEEVKARQKFEEDFRTKQRIIEQQRISPLHRHSQSDHYLPHEDRRRATRQEHETDTHSKKYSVQENRMTVPRQKVIEEQRLYGDDFSTGKCTTEKNESQAQLTSRMQNE
jgi:hypothetical protein